MRPATIIGRLNTRAVPFNTKFGSMTSGVTAKFVAENAPAPVAALAAETIALGLTKMAIIVPITQELAENSSPAATATVIADCGAGIASGMDAAFLDPDGVAVVGLAPASITHGATIIQSSGPTAANILADAKLAMKALDAGRFPLRECTWIMDQSVFIHLSTLVTTTGEPAFDDLSDGGTWVGGLPVLVSGAKFGAVSAPAGLIALMHGPSVAVADSNTALVSVSLDAAIVMDTAPAAGPIALTSLWQNDLVGVRTTRFINWARRRSGCVATIRNIAV
jgi:HK97 family phage major capsid protein